MNDKKLQASEIIAYSCCGHMLDIPIHKLIEKVKNIEDENKKLKLEITALRARLFGNENG